MFMIVLMGMLGDFMIVTMAMLLDFCCAQNALRASDSTSP